MKAITLTLNGNGLAAAVEPRTHLADFLRESQGLTGTHLGCEHGICGACTLLVDGVPVRSCITYAVACDGAAVTTIEGLDEDEIAKELRQAFSREHALQCGYCTPGMLMSARDVAIRADGADEQEIRVAMSGNLCRCTGYVGIIRAVSSVIESRRARGIAAVPDAGRREIGPAGSGHASTSGATHVERRATPEALPPVAKDAGAPPIASVADFHPQATFTQTFVVRHPREEVWAFFERLNDVAACLPGASITGGDDRTVTGTMRVKIGPIAAAFDGVAVFDRDPSAYSGTIRGSGRDTRTGSATRGSIAYRLVTTDDGRSTGVDIAVGYALTGALAQFGRSELIRDIVNRISQAFVQNLEARLAAPGQASLRPVAELNAGSLVLSALAERIRRWFRKLVGRGET